MDNGLPVAVLDCYGEWSTPSRSSQTVVYLFCTAKDLASLPVLTVTVFCLFYAVKDSGLFGLDWYSGIPVTESWLPVLNCRLPVDCYRQMSSCSRLSQKEVNLF